MQLKKITNWLGANWKLIMLTPMVIALMLLALRWLIGLPWDSPNAPAWVQAVGSIFAIFTAVGISYWQASHATLERRRQAYRYMFRAYQVAGNAVAALMVVGEGIRDEKLSPSRISYFKTNLRTVQEELSPFQYHEMVDVGFGSNWAEIKKHVAFMLSRIEAHEHEPDSIKTSMNIPLGLETYQRLFKELREILQAHSKRVGKRVYEDQNL